MTIIAEGYIHNITCARCGADGKQHFTRPLNPVEFSICVSCEEIVGGSYRTSKTLRKLLGD
jgi:hypothetical protein